MKDKNDKFNSKAGAGGIAAGIFAGLVGVIATQMDDGFWIAIVAVGALVLIFAALLPYLLYLKTIGIKVSERKAMKTNKEYTKRLLDNYDYAADIENPQIYFYLDPVGTACFVDGGLNIFSFEDKDCCYEYETNKNNIIFNTLKLSDEERAFEEKRGISQIPAHIPYADIKFSAWHLNSTDELPHNYVHVSFLYQGKEMSGNIALTKHVLHWIRQFNLDVEGLDKTIAPREKFVNSKATLFVFNHLSIIGISDLGISLSHNRRFDEFIILYSEIESITIAHNIMFVKTKMKSFFFPFKEEILKTLKANYFGEIITADNFCDYVYNTIGVQLLISNLTIETAIGSDSRCYAEIFKMPHEDKYFYIISVFDDVFNYWSIQNKGEEVVFFETQEVALESAKECLWLVSAPQSREC